jgi:hypothetical protein
MQCDGISPTRRIESTYPGETPARYLATDMQGHRLEEPGTAQEYPALHGSGDQDQVRVVWESPEKQMIYRVVDPETDEIIQQVPSDEVLRVSHNIDFLLSSERTEVDVST